MLTPTVFANKYQQLSIWGVFIGYTTRCFMMLSFIMTIYTRQHTSQFLLELEWQCGRQNCGLCLYKYNQLKRKQTQQLCAIL